jgi:anti-sigma regulatory factor (Ser/Thr protein kinase)
VAPEDHSTAGLPPPTSIPVSHAECAPSWSQLFALSSGPTAGSSAAVLVRKTCDHFGICTDDAQAFELCVAEAVNNASEHAYQAEEGLPIWITLLFSDDTLSLRIVESGRPMLAGTLAAARMPEPDPNDPTTWAERGRGLAILKESMDGVVYEALDGQNTLNMSKRVNFSVQGTTAEHDLWETPDPESTKGESK